MFTLRSILSMAIVLPIWMCAASVAAAAAPSDDLTAAFQKPPASARPWVYWFWINGNIAKEGITADLEAMQRVGIGGALDHGSGHGCRDSAGPVAFASPAWRELFKHVCREAERLGLQVNMSNDAGWTGSAGPWITPEQSMQKLVWTETDVDGPRQIEVKLPQPPAVANFYRDIAVLAYPTPADPFRIAQTDMKSLRFHAPGDEFSSLAAWPAAPADAAIRRSSIVDLTARLDKDSRLTWDAPAGKWTHPPPGPHVHRHNQCAVAVVRPRTGMRQAQQGSDGGALQRLDGQAASRTIATAGGPCENAGLHAHRQLGSRLAELDAADARGVPAAARLRPVAAAAGDDRPRGRQPGSLRAVPVGRAADGLRRCSWRIMPATLRELANRHGMRLSIEAYGGCPCNDMTYAGQADEPMAEFWSCGYDCRG